MAIPSDFANLVMWFKADAEAFSDGDLVGTWTDQAAAYDLTQGTTGYKPIFKTNVINGLPALLFDGSDDRLANATRWSLICTAHVHTIFAVFRAFTVDQARHSSVAGEGIFGEGTYWDAGLSVCTVDGVPGVNGIYRYDPGSVTVHTDVAAPANEWHFAYTRANGSNLYTVVDGSAVATASYSGSYFSSGAMGGPIAGFNPAGGVNYPFHGYIAEIVVYSDLKAGSDLAALVDYIQAKYFPATPAQTEQTRDVLSRKLWLRRKPQGVLTVTVPLWALDADVLDRVYVQTETAPSEDGLGWRAKPWQRRAFSVQRLDLSSDGSGVKLQLLDRRQVDLLLWDAGWSRKGGTGTKADGVARIGTGGARTFTRASRGWPVNPADSAQVVGAIDAEPLIDYDGELFEAAATNGMLRSSAVSGTTGWTLTGSGSVAVDTAELLFHSDVTLQSWKLTAASPHSSDGIYTGPDTASYSGSSTIRVAVDHLDNGGEAAAVRIQRLVDNFYWNDSTGAWVSTSPINNTLPVVSTKSPASRWVSKAIGVGASATAIRVAFVMPSGGTASRIYHLYHVQIDNRGQIGSRIVTDGAAYTRVKSRLLIENNSSKRCWIGAVGSAGAEVVPLWDAADIGSTNRSILYAYHDANNSFEIRYNGTSDRFEFVVIRGGTTYTAYRAVTVTRGTAYKVVARWTGTEAELELTAFTASIFVDGVKGTDAVFASAVTEAATANLEVGSKADAENWDGHLRRRFVRPYALTDNEAARYEA